MDTVPLRDAIRALRVEVLEAAKAASGELVQFELGPIEMEFQVVAKKEKELDAKFSFHIFAVAEATLGGGGKGIDERTQKVKVVLEPILVEEDGATAKIRIGREAVSKRGTSSKSTLERR